MSRCRSCGAKIRWIKMESGKMMPVDDTPITFRSVDPKSEYAKVLVLDNGTVTTGYFDPEGDKIGYTSHFATCPNANQHRRPKK